jgi:hypothetical protein
LHKLPPKCPIAGAISMLSPQRRCGNPWLQPHRPSCPSRRSIACSARSPSRCIETNRKSCSGSACSPKRPARIGITASRSRRRAPTSPCRGGHEAVQERPLRQKSTGCRWSPLQTRMPRGSKHRSSAWPTSLALATQPFPRDVTNVTPEPLEAKKCGRRSRPALPRGGRMGDLSRTWICSRRQPEDGWPAIRSPRRRARAMPAAQSGLTL